MGLPTRPGVDMCRWYADNSELLGPWGAEIPDVLLLGGFAIDAASERELCTRVERIKRDFADPPDFPLKWNLKDLRASYESSGRGDLYRRLIDESKEWRRAIFQAIALTDVRLFVSCFVCRGSRRSTLKALRPKLTGATFANGLQRFGLYVRRRYDAAEVILDWPDKNEREPFEREYREAYRAGETAFGSHRYHCGPLQRLGFADSPSFKTMRNCNLLQVADLVVGACRELVELAIEKREQPGLGTELLGLVLDKFDGAPGDVARRGLVVAPTGPVRDSVAKVLDELRGVAR